MFIVGIDIAKRNHVVKIITSKGESVCKAFPIRNNCTGYNLLLERLRKDGYSVVVLNPIQTYAMRDLMIREKTDHIDALIIAEVIRFGRYSVSSVPQEKLLAMRELCRKPLLPEGFSQRFQMKTHRFIKPVVS